MAITDNSIMPFGKFKGDAMVNVPNWHLKWLHEGNHPRDEYMREQFPQVFEYLEDVEEILYKDNEKS